MKKLLPVLLFAISCLACKKEQPQPKPELKQYPAEITRTFSNSADVVKQIYHYNAENQLVREDIFRNNNLERSNRFSYNAAGKLQFKHVYGSTGRMLEQDEMLYSSSNRLQKLLHSYLDSAGNPGLHHQRIYQFDSAGRILRISDLSPDNQLTSSYDYTYKAGNLVESVGTGDQGQFLNKIDITYDGRQHPFVNTGIYLLQFPGNEQKTEIKDENGQVVLTVSTQLEYHENGFPRKRIQTQPNGQTITDSFIYKSE